MSGESLYGRSCRVIIQGMSATQGDYLNPGPGQAIEIDGSDDKANPGLRIQFKITKTREKHPNTGEITISNLSPPRRASMQAKGVKVTLEAGYVSTGRTRIFSCDARTVAGLWSVTRATIPTGYAAVVLPAAFVNCTGRDQLSSIH